MASQPSSGYLQLLRTNTPFRRLWYGQVVSELGDWLNSIAIYTLILQLGGGGLAMATAMMAKLLPIFFVSPIAGVLIDRLDRRRIMIWSDVLRFGVVLGFLVIDEPDELWFLYTLTVLEIALAGFFEPARSALIPSLTDRRDLVTANALSGSTWSVMLAVGAALGGVVVSLLGLQAAFILDAFTFLLSAWFISRVTPSVRTARAENTLPSAGAGFRDLFDGLRYLKAKPNVLVLALLKSGLAVAGGIMTLIPLYAHRMFSTPAEVSMAIGAMYSARGLGAALGPVLVKRLFGDSARVLQTAIGFGFLLGGASIYIFAQSEQLLWACTGAALMNFFGSIIWVFSSALIHLEAEDRFLGRVFSTEIALLTLVMGLSNWITGYSVDALGWTAGEVARAMALAFVVPGGLWAGFLLARRRTTACVTSVCPVEPSDSRVPPTSL